MKHWPSGNAPCTGCGISLNLGPEIAGGAADVECRACDIVRETNEVHEMVRAHYGRMWALLGLPDADNVRRLDDMGHDIESAVKSLVEKAGGKP